MLRSRDEQDLEVKVQRILKDKTSQSLEELDLSFD